VPPTFPNPTIRIILHAEEMKEDSARVGTGGLWDVFIGADSTSSSLSNKYRQLVSFGFVFYVVASPSDDEY